MESRTATAFCRPACYLSLMIQKWSSRVATRLPWLVIPVIGLYLLSQLLPPEFRFKITTPKMAAAFALLITLFCYEILPQLLSAWTDRKKSKAIETQKLRKIKDGN